MSESLLHHNLVFKIFDYVKQTIAVCNENTIYIDSFESVKPRLTYTSYVPDLFYKDHNYMIIGEAKTLDDFNRPHSYDQYEAYFRELDNFPYESILIICVPWELCISASDHFKLLKQRYKKSIKVIILSNFGEEEVI